MFHINKAVEILERTPATLSVMLGGLSSEWLYNNEGEDTWSPYDVLGHLIHGELTDWIPRMNIILSDSMDKTFAPFDRFAQFENSKGKSVQQLLDKFAQLRRQNLAYLDTINLTEPILSKTGKHPEFGEVTLKQLLSTWVVHDLNHIAQISRTMAKQYKKDAGPWKAYLRVLK